MTHAKRLRKISAGFLLLLLTALAGAAPAIPAAPATPAAPLAVSAPALKDPDAKADPATVAARPIF